jgi:hypothetical protein
MEGLTFAAILSGQQLALQKLLALKKFMKKGCCAVSGEAAFISPGRTHTA